ncbi:hypothetical protein KEM54_003615 [Ascosphaera aggregata]|nr:hypothetical protein KEM54_003615 [Ascosphaera aggregata]
MSLRKSLSMREACKLALERLPQGHRELRFHRPVYEGDQSDPALYATACFKDLNEILFRGIFQLHPEKKKSNVILKWAEPDGTNLGYTRFGYTSSPGVDDENCVVITLNEHAKKLGNWGGDILAVLIHQMAHAYFLICCGWRAKGLTGSDGNEHDLEHDINYCALLYKIQDVLHVTYAAYTDLFRCLPLQEDHLNVHDVPPYVSGRSCCDWMGIHKPSDEEIQSYIRDLMSGSLEEATPSSSFSGMKASSHNKANGLGQENATDEGEQQIDTLTYSPNGHHTNGSMSPGLSRLEELEARLNASNIENRRLREALLKILTMASQAKLDTKILRETAQELGTNLTLPTPPPTAQHDSFDIGPSQPAQGGEDEQDSGIVIHRENNEARKDHHRHSTPRGEMSPTRGAAQALRDHLEPGRGMLDETATSDAVSGDNTQKPKENHFVHSYITMSSGRRNLPFVDIPQEFTYEAVPVINRDEDTQDYEIEIELQDGTSYIIQRRQDPMTPSDLRTALAAERKAFPSEATLNELMEKEILKPEPVAQEKEDLTERVGY